MFPQFKEFFSFGYVKSRHLILSCRSVSSDSVAGRTIFALSSGRGKCGVAVIRVSGSQSRSVLCALAGESILSKPRFAHLRTLRDPQSREILDRAIVLWFPGPKSFTGEDTCEFQVHGGLAVVSGLLEALGKMPGVYPADPGEFSKRAFFNGSMDLTEAEGLSDLIHAETEMQRKQALHQMSGSLHVLYNKWRNTLLQDLAHVEAYIDFSEDENIEDDVMDRVDESLTKLSNDIQMHLADGCRGQRLRDGVRATIVGEPNVGKSSLLNLICKKPAAIVTAIAGTTRDVVEQYINISGYPLSLADTAGIRGEMPASDVVEIEGIARAKKFAQSADIILLTINASQFLMYTEWQQNQNVKIFKEFLEQHISHLDLKNSSGDKLNWCLKSNDDGSVLNSTLESECIVIINKIDLVEDKNVKKSLCNLGKSFKNVAVLSCLTGEGLPDLMLKLKLSLEILCGNPNMESPALSQVRHRHHLTDCLASLQNYLRKAGERPESQNNVPIEAQCADLAICAEDLRRAIHHLGRITGHVSTDQILDVIFRDFCIGK
ncbi:hypothetical protein ONE63_008011 [Megalurothrips usitatus]|uniref:tRNA modification GTPase GTPBP3, mitochondrial n=1 Tax=Megalurothrips usitatus TaxID=439358 RepID=A0AAV7XQK5_9NEOP|nr:hypothetical protein ONE63_008011 [Megalurothrips usitatus]